ncbi:MAG: hypothetical protein D6710_11815 [Nitrospirae bacterium]|nr:MAG: hypothetical protein D6710_11815 [Nitrospirota bacterium]
MPKVEDIKPEIEKLSEEEYRQIRNWLFEKDWAKWDEEIERDSEEGKLDFLIEQAKKSKREGKLKPL